VISPLEIDVDACRSRQKRLQEAMQQLQLDVVIVTRTEHVQWLAGPRFGWMFEPAAALTADGQLTLVAPNREPEVAAADQVVTYEAQWNCTLRNDQRQACTAALSDVLANRKFSARRRRVVLLPAGTDQSGCALVGCRAGDLSLAPAKGPR